MSPILTYSISGRKRVAFNALILTLVLVSMQIPSIRRVVVEGQGASGEILALAGMWSLRIYVAFANVRGYPNTPWYPGSRLWHRLKVWEGSQPWHPYQLGTSRQPQHATRPACVASQTRRGFREGCMIGRATRRSACSGCRPYGVHYRKARVLIYWCAILVRG
jgi:hypothetical protein